MSPDDQLELVASIVGPGELLVALAEVYVDESGTHDGAPVLCVAGYIFYRRHALEFTRKFSRDLASKNVKFWHSTDCNPDPGNGPCAGVCKDDRIWLQTQLIQKTRKFTQYGIGVTVNEADYNSVIGKNHAAENAYSWLLWMVLTAVANWIEATKFEGHVSYIFEAGHDHQSSANAMMDWIFRDPEMRHRMRYAKHSFTPKECAVPLQSADLLAWHWALDFKKRLEGKPRRKDLDALLVENRDQAAHFDRASLTEHAADMAWANELYRRYVRGN